VPIVHFERLGHLLHDEMSAGTGVQLLQGSHQRDDTAGSGQLSREIPYDMYLHKIMKTLTRLHGEEAY